MTGFPADPTPRQGSRLPGPQERLGGPAHGPEDHRACTDPQGGDALLGMKKISLGFIIFSIYYLRCVNLTMRSGNLEWNSERKRDVPACMESTNTVYSNLNFGERKTGMRITFISLKKKKKTNIQSCQNQPWQLIKHPKEGS